MYIHFIWYFLRTIKDGLNGTISEIKTEYITIPRTAVLSCQYEKNPTLRWRHRGFIGDETQNICFNSANWNYIILPASLNITLVSVVIELSCASHTYKPRSSISMKLSKRMSTSCTLGVYDSPLFKARGVRATLEGNNLFIYV
jgi:hypothetical protein